MTLVSAESTQQKPDWLIIELGANDALRGQDLRVSEQVALEPFFLADVALDPTLMQTDGLHPNEKAQPLIAQRVKRWFYPLLSAQSSVL